MRQSAKRRQRAFDLFRLNIQRQCRRGRRHRVAYIVPPAQTKTLEADSAPASAEVEANRGVLDPQRCGVVASRVSEADHLRADAARKLPYVRVVAIQNRVVGRILVFEQARLCTSIVFETPLTIKITVAQIQIHPTSRTKPTTQSQ